MKKIVYVFLSRGTGIDQLAKNILPQLEANTLGVDVLGMCFFDENAKILDAGEFIGNRLSRIASEKSIILMIAEKVALNPKSGSDRSAVGKKLTPAECPVITISDGHQIACFPDVYTALNGRRPDYIISL